MGKSAVRESGSGVIIAERPAGAVAEEGKAAVVVEEEEVEVAGGGGGDAVLFPAGDWPFDVGRLKFGWGDISRRSDVCRPILCTNSKQIPGT